MTGCNLLDFGKPARQNGKQLPCERLMAENAKLREECQNVAPWYLDFLCSECGFVHYHSDENDTDDGNEWHFCPNCGRHVPS